MSTASKGRLVIISGPSGAGKSTVLQNVLQQCKLPLELSVSATTRKPRSGEVDGVHYHFLSVNEFAARRDNDEFLEWKEVYPSILYGTYRKTVTAGLNRGKWVVLEIDVEGAMMAMESYPEAITIFLHPGGIDVLERRLRDRKTETEEAMQQRLEVARREMTVLDQYRHEVINDDTIEKAGNDICELLTREV